MASAASARMGVAGLLLSLKRCMAIAAVTRAHASNPVVTKDRGMPKASSPHSNWGISSKPTKVPLPHTSADRAGAWAGIIRLTHSPPSKIGTINARLVSSVSIYFSRTTVPEGSEKTSSALSCCRFGVVTLLRSASNVNREGCISAI